MAVSSVQAAIVVYDGLDYETGNLAGNNGGDGWSDAWANVSGTLSIGSDSLAYSDLETEGNRIQETSNGSRQAARSFDITGYNDAGDHIWFSTLVNLSSAGTGSNFKFFAVGSGSDNGGIGYQITPGATNIALGVRNAPNESASGDRLTLNYDETYLIVGRIAFGADTATTGLTTTLWVNPDLNANFDNTSDGDIALTSNVFASQIGGAVFVGSFTNTRLNGFDELRVGTTYASVTPVIPEPSTGVLLIGGLAGFILMRRRAMAVG